VSSRPAHVAVDQYISTDGQVYAIWTEKRRSGGYELSIDTDESMDASAVAADRTLVALALDEETTAIVRTAVESGEYLREADPPVQLAAVAEYGTGV
jgi:hypothetical protein